MPSFGNEVGTDVEIATEKNISPDNNKIASTKPKLQHKDKNRSVKPIVLSPAPIPVDMCDQIPNKLEQNQAKKLDMAMQPPSTQSATQSIVVPSETNTIKPKRSHIKQNIQASKIQAELPIIDVRNVDTIESTDTVQTKIVKDKAKQKDEELALTIDELLSLPEKPDDDGKSLDELLDDLDVQIAEQKEKHRLQIRKLDEDAVIQQRRKLDREARYAANAINRNRLATELTQPVLKTMFGNILGFLEGQVRGSGPAVSNSGRGGGPTRRIVCAFISEPHAA